LQFVCLLLNIFYQILNSYGKKSNTLEGLKYFYDYTN
jgi:hypothetical protein